MNIMTQICGLVILGIIIYFTLTNKTLKLQTNIAFGIMLGVATANMLIEIGTVYLVTMYNDASPLFIEIVCKIYMIFTISMGFCALYYAYADIYTNKTVRRRKTCIQVIIYTIAYVIMFALPIQWRELNGQVDVGGPAVTVVYGVGIYTFCWIMYVVASNKKMMNERRRRAVFCWISIWCATAFFQHIIPEVRLISFGEALGIFIVYCMFENPEAYIDKLTGLFNQKAFEEYVKKLFSNKVKFSMYMLVFPNVSSIKAEDMSEVEKKTHKEFVLFLKAMQGAKVFCDADSQIEVVFDDTKEGEKSKIAFEQKVKREWSQKYSIYSNVKYFYVKDARFTTDAHSFIRTLRYARENNRDRIQRGIIPVDSVLFEQMVKESMVELLIEEAIENDRIEVYYQPIYSTEKKRFTTAEALVRIRDENGDIVPPGNFINIAEENGMIIRLGEIVFEKVCQFISTEEYKKLNLEYIEINLSVVQCSYRHLAKDYIAIMEKYNINPNHINLEITESASIDAKNMLLDNMNRLIDYGIKFSLDDFGTGQSNLNYIAEMPVEIVKFDKDMINAYFDNNKTQYVMDAAMGMIKGMQMEIVSEGIETNEQYERMKKLGINYIQGYYFSKPVPKEQFVDFIMKANSEIC